MKKTLAFVLALAMVFSTITVAFAEDAATPAAPAIGADAQICADLGMLKGATGTVDAAYLATAPSRIQAAIMFLRLKGLEAEATAFTGTENFADANLVAWAEGKNILAYLKAHPELGWAGDGTNFDPNSAVTAQQYYKVMLEALGYKQNTATVVGDFTWENVIAFAAEKGLTKVAAVTSFTVNDVAIATVEALKANVKEGGKTLVASLVEAGKVDSAKATAAGLIVAATTAAVKSAKALGNSVAEVTFEAAIDAAAANVSNYTIEGLEVTAAVVTGEKTVRLTTAAMSSGKVYTLTVGGKAVKFTGIAKVSSGPELDEAKGEDVEEVVLTFDKDVDYATATDVANYTIAGVTVVKAEITDVKEVTLTTEGLKDNTNYKVKAANIKSIDGVVRKATSYDFKSDYDTAAPRIEGDVDPQTNQRLVLTFDEPVTEESAENLDNYSIVDEDDTELEITSIVWDADPDGDEDNVEITTAAQTENEEYTLKISNIADQRKVANVMTRTLSEKFEGQEEDTDEPEVTDPSVISKNQFVLTFTDDSKIDEASVLATSSYTLTDEDDNYVDIEKVETLKNVNETFIALVTVDDMVAGDSYELQVVDILDEFGNALEEANLDVDPTIDDFAAANVTNIKYNNENKVTVTFDKRLVEATAENIAAYSFNNSLGAPTKATYDDLDDGTSTVTLAVNDMVNGKKYKLTVDGVQDIAGNVLKFTTANIYPAKITGPVVAGTNEDWDETAPKLESAKTLNKYVAALTFDEEVTFEDDTRLILMDKDGNILPNELVAKKNSGDKNEVVEFSLFGDVDQNAGTPNAWAALDPTVTYYVYKIVYGAGNEYGSIKDLMGNSFMQIANYSKMEDFHGDASDPDYAEVKKIEQVNGGSFDVTMTENVLFTAAIQAGLPDSDADGDKNDETYTDGEWDISISDNVVTFVHDTALVKTTSTFDIDLNDYFTDEHGMAVVNDDVDVAEGVDKTTLTADSTDGKAPFVESVKALDRKTVEITFSEDIKDALATDFAIYNTDMDDADVRIASIDVDGSNVVTLTLTDRLEGRYEYNLQMDGNAVADFAGKLAAEDKDLYFDGSDAADY